MSFDILRGRTKHNFAIKEHPPIGSYEYDFIRGLPQTKAPEYPQPRKRTDAERAYDVLGSVDTVSNTDFDAAQRWMSNFAEQVNYTSKVHKNAFDQREIAAWVSLWKRWLLICAKVKQDGMSPNAKNEYEKLLNESLVLYKHFRRLGMSQVAIPYMGDLVVMLRTLPPELTLKQMAMRLREGIKAGERLLDENTAWWQWKLRTDTAGLLRAIDAARSLASKFESTSKDKKQQGPREKGSFAYDLFLQALTRIPIEAAGLYGIEETLRTAKAEFKDNLKDNAQKTSFDLITLGVVAGLGYIGYKWWTRPQTTIVVSSLKPGYYPKEADTGRDDPEEDERI
jgi:hypothetical protein